MLDRRQFLSAAAASAALALIRASHAAHAAAPNESRDLAHPGLLAALGAETVREIGAAYGALVPAEHDRATLEAALSTDLRAGRAAIEDVVRADFAAGRVIVVHDWMLSRTEARQCALFSLRAA